MTPFIDASRTDAISSRVDAMQIADAVAWSDVADVEVVLPDVEFTPCYPPCLARLYAHCPALDACVVQSTFPAELTSETWTCYATGVTEDTVWDLGDQLHDTVYDARGATCYTVTGGPQPPGHDRDIFALDGERVAHLHSDDGYTQTTITCDGRDYPLEYESDACRSLFTQAPCSSGPCPR